MSASPPAERPGRKPRVIAAVLLSLLFCGLGHIAIGHWRRALVWLGAVAICYLGLFAGALLGAVWLVIAAIAAGLGLRLATAVDTVRLPRPERLPGKGRVALIAVALLVGSELVSAATRAWAVEVFALPAASMTPTLEPGDHVIVEKLGRRPGVGDVVAFRYPLDPEVSYIKRIVALGGETIEIRGGIIHRDGRPEPAREGLGTPPEMAPVLVPSGQVFVMGDNYDNSNDSRVWGPLPSDLVIGRAKWIWWSSGAEGVRWQRIGQPVP